MKNVLLFFLILTANTLFAQEKEIAVNEKNIVKKWVFDKVINAGKTADEIKEMNELMESVTFTFKADKTFILDFMTEQTGTWELDKVKKVITTKDKRGTSNWTIHSLTPNTITLSRVSGHYIAFKAE